MSPQVNWSEGVPSGTSAVGLAPPFLTSQWTAISQGLSTEALYWDGSGTGSKASRGELQQGAPKSFVGSFSRSSNADIKLNGRAYFDSTTSRMFLYDSSGTYLIGTPFQVKYGSSAATHFLALSGFTKVSNVTTANTNSLGIITLSPDATTGLPFLNINGIFTQSSEASVLLHATLNSVAPAGNLVLQYIGLAGAPSVATFFWQVTGTSMFT